ncbi:mediator of RNA polymerase II transcription subunit 26-like [Centruroides vittatus]|uniref:mediator of RNA polymerase II transcription subunit 26-like n=1 Tax=Centruroides vittatus TaxID=120091 RepID=UPI00351074B4
MPNTLHDIKDKLLSALDPDYNVVDMATVIEVISILEKTSITKDALEKTRIGKFINELRKKTSNEQLARRAKELVKKWRKLLPVPDHPTINGERIVGSISTPPVGMTPAGPGPGPGVGPGPGPGNKPASPAICRTGSGSIAKFASPALMSERATSPCSSASNSPHLPPRHQGSNRTTVTPSVHVTNKLPASDQALGSVVSNGNSATCNQMFKPVSPALAAVQMVSGAGGKQELHLSGTNLACPKPHSPAGRNPVSLHNSSRSLSPCLNISSKSLPSRHLQETSSPHSSAQHSTISSHSGISHSSLDLAKTNAANKRLRKDLSPSLAGKKRRIEDQVLLNANVANGMDPAHFKNRVTVEIMPSKGSAFESFKANETKDETKEQESAFNDSFGKKKKKVGPPSHHEGPKTEGMSTGLKLQKVKTTQQLIAELQAKKGAMPSIDLLPNLTSDSRNCRTNDVTLGLLLKRSGNCALFGSDAEVNKTKSELMDRFLQASANEKGLESPARESAQLDLAPPEEKPKIHVDRVGEEIEQLMASLPDISSLEIPEEEEEYVPVKVELTEEAILKISTENWENVNGEYDREGKWKEWHEMTTRESYEGDSLNILPYVNIDW